MEGHDQMDLIGENFENGLMGRMRDDENDSRSGSDNFEGGSGDDQDAGDNTPQRKKKYHRHTPQQIQQLESFFKDCPHPDEKQRSDLGKKLGLENKQIKFWFQNRRTQMKAQLERHENMILKQENDKLRAENTMMREAIENPICNNCGGHAIPGQISMEEHQMRIENARLQDELNRVSALTNKFFGGPVSRLASPIAMPTPNSGLNLSIGRNAIGGSSNFAMPLPMGLDLGEGVLGNPPPPPLPMSGIRPPMGNGVQIDPSMLANLAASAMDELIGMAQIDNSLWIKSSDGGKEVLNHEEYARMSSIYNGTKPIGYATEATRETGVVLINSLALVDSLMDVDLWSEMFPSMIARAVTLGVIFSVAGTRNGTLQLMNAELQLVSPLVPVRQVNFLRYCKQHAVGIWVVVDLSVDIGRNATNSYPIMSCRKLPSGCIVQDMSNGLTKITWIDHSQYDESVIPQLYRPLVSSGIGFGAQRWIATLQRQCQCLAILSSPSIRAENTKALVGQPGMKSLLKLTQRMTECFCSGICSSSIRKWEIIPLATIADDMKLMTRKNVDDPGEALGIMLSVATSVWMPVSRQRLFDFLRDARMRRHWDDSASDVTVNEIHSIVKAQGQGNCISILRANVSHANDYGNSIYVQESWTDATGSMIVYSPINAQALKVVVSGGDSACVRLLPSGFTILPDGNSNSGNGDGSGGGGCLLTVGRQIMVNNLPQAKFTVESVTRLNDTVSGTIQKIKAALGVA
ncbi:homeobox-leucine zipper protein ANTHOCYANINLESS 2-like [Gastrolobium bilobum]|uniref:homeobox-leucine zipper protein ANTHOCYANINLESS 2-like n=1 Tax=Gastrolobium bilobum TaxID=150636 RepID=UPI002AB29A76|nr:homeobox-leucine zipper protein ANTHOCYANINLESS 2-like [Gastrolobium bilobum]